MGTKILDLIPESLKDELIQEVRDLIEEEKQKGPTDEDVKKSIDDWVRRNKPKNQKPKK